MNFGSDLSFDFVLPLEAMLSSIASAFIPVAGLPNELHESVDGSRRRRLTPNRELASSTLGSVFETSFDGVSDDICCIISELESKSSGVDWHNRESQLMFYSELRASVSTIIIMCNQ